MTSQNNQRKQLLDNLKRHIVREIIKNNKHSYRKTKGYHCSDTTYALGIDILPQPIKLALKVLSQEDRENLLTDFAIEYVEADSDYFLWDSTTVTVPELQFDSETAKNRDLNTITTILDQELKKNKTLVNITIDTDQLTSLMVDNGMGLVLCELYEKYPRLTTILDASNMYIIGVHPQASIKDLYEALVEKAQEPTLTPTMNFDIEDVVGINYLKYLTDDEKNEFLSYCGKVTMLPDGKPGAIVGDGLDCEIYSFSYHKAWDNMYLSWAEGTHDNKTKRDVRERKQRYIKLIEEAAHEKVQQHLDEAAKNDPSESIYQFTMELELPLQNTNLSNHDKVAMENYIASYLNASLKQRSVVVYDLRTDGVKLSTKALYLPLMDTSVQNNIMKFTLI